MKIKEKVLKEGIKNIEGGLHSLFVLEKAIDLTLAEVNKVIDDLEVYPTEITEGEVIYGSVEMINKKELKQKLGGTN